ncbi:unnamed protein product [Lymnaea stagnalis]|uniref:UPAR/Ly6 domain-containing protein n=1 Tax=Lymnaea stagnalis TaxID=6523 RepID=A0AAV2I7F7_LYMST
MRSASQLLFASIVVTIIHSLPVESISCTTCRSNNPACETGAIAPTACPPEQTRCFISHVYIDGGVQRGTFRGCTHQPLSAEGCNSLRHPTLTGVVCTNICDWEGCNSHVIALT